MCYVLLQCDDNVLESFVLREFSIMPAICLICKRLNYKLLSLCTLLSQKPQCKELMMMRILKEEALVPRDGACSRAQYNRRATVIRRLSRRCLHLSRYEVCCRCSFRHCFLGIALSLAPGLHIFARSPCAPSVTTFALV
jgi:hypothetical protein